MKRALALFAAVAAISSQAAAAPDRQDRRVQIVNASSQPIFNLYASPVTSSTWEEDLLGDSVIDAGSSLVADIDNGTAQCNYDIKIVMANNREHIRRRVNVCTVSRITVTDKGMSTE